MALKSSGLHRIAMKNWPLIGQWPPIGQFTLCHAVTWTFDPLTLKASRDQCLYEI